MIQEVITDVLEEVSDLDVSMDLENSLEMEASFSSEDSSDLENSLDLGNYLDSKDILDVVSETDIEESGESILDILPIVGIDYDAVYDAVYSASYDAIELYSQTVTDGQMINSTALSYFQGVLGNQFWPVDYVIYVGDSYKYGTNTYYEYCMAYGDLSVSRTHFTGEGVTLVKIRVNGGYHDVSIMRNQSIDLVAPYYYSRSNLGNYSGVYSYDWTGLMILITMMIGGLVWLVKKLLRLSH